MNPEFASHRELLAGRGRPAFGGILVTCGSDATDGVLPSFLYFKKLTTPSRVQWRSGDIYEVTAIYDDRRQSRRGWSSRIVLPVVFHVVVTADGDVHLLLEATKRSAKVVARRGRRKTAFDLSSTHWDYPSHVKSIAADRSEGPEVFAVGLFLMAFLTSQECQKKVIVRVKRSGAVAAFGIAVDRAKAFFADRDASEVAADGKRKRIFHSVVAHDRILTAGKRVAVKQHYRGLRHFNWKGSAVAIVFPRNNRVLEFDRPAFVAEDLSARNRREMMSADAVGKAFDKALSA